MLHMTAESRPKVQISWRILGTATAETIANKLVAGAHSRSDLVTQQRQQARCCILDMRDLAPTSITHKYCGSDRSSLKCYRSTRSAAQQKKLNLLNAC